jgi:hypothetical protein
MVTGEFHCPICGLDFTRDVLYGDYNVTCPLGHLLPYESLATAVSHCDCPVCRKVFDVDLVPDAPDGSGEFVPGSLEFNVGIHLINFWMMI